MSGYRYTPLEEADAIRLLVLYPSADPTAPLGGSLFNTTISDCDADFEIEYLALSYVWGDPTRRGFIELDGVGVEITASLAEALQHLRNSCPKRTQTVWADALCINQSDTPEKNRQVPLMGNIYAHAKSTIIYLGPLTANSKMIFEAAQNNAPRVATVDAQGIAHIASPRQLRENRAVNIHESEGPNCTALQQMQSTYLNAESQTLFGILQSRGRCRASDPRDMVFAYMGMHNDPEEVSAFVTVDYDVTLRELLISTARYISECHGYAQLLRCVKRHGSSSSWLELPSWVPDWGISEWLSHPTPLSWPLGQASPSDTLALLQKPGQAVDDIVSPVLGPMEICFLSPILPYPSEMPEEVLGFLRKMSRESLRVEKHVFDVNWKNFGASDYKESKTARAVEMVEFFENLVLPSTTEEPPMKLFSEDFWRGHSVNSSRSAENIQNLENRPATFSMDHAIAFAVRQIMSFFQAYTTGSNTVVEGFSFDIDTTQRVRLAATAGRFVVAVPAAADTVIGDMAVLFQDGRVKKDGCLGYTGCVLRPMTKETGDPFFKYCKVISTGGVPDMAEEYLPYMEEMPGMFRPILY
ncbi:hypothetical protein CkaCkLH20_10099 [Colletotrichum karsti]|uniref:Heterokaryon incompatibility domain-containing protein n=1 Tax=Colletotrichum karsti TaxID=1095194 RepID=A0A9P6HY74_9PEZI|nr:uncharacterized protein CkaCkLH20_10099 [Colletotrichum karsti]KAF9872272.1 hypothetical protein CkaCkLH20_10099 [Colletotrichum karsti]